MKNQAPVFLTTSQKKENPFFRQLIKINLYNYNNLYQFIVFCTSSEKIVPKEKIVLQHMRGWHIQNLFLARNYVCLFFFFSVDPTAPDYTYNQPKFNVYYGMLWKLFLLLCFNCKAENPQVSMRQNGTMVTVMQQCCKCKGFFWTSQSYMPHMWQTSCG